MLIGIGDFIFNAKRGKAYYFVIKSLSVKKKVLPLPAEILRETI